MSLAIRGEKVSDYHSITQVNALAFGSMEEPVLVDLLRHSARFNPELSLVAVVDGQIVGHALYVVYDVQMGGAVMPAAELAPLAVHPDYQRHGVGTALLHEAHRRLVAQGCQFAFLLGHDSYYPRVGYQTKMFGQCAIEVRCQELPQQAGMLTARKVTRRDLLALQAMWQVWMEDVDLARLPGNAISDWVSSHPQASTLVLVDDEDAAQAYVRYLPGRAHKPLAVLARDRDGMAEALVHLAAQVADDVESLELPMHPDCAATQALMPVSWQARTALWSAAMILPLADDNLELGAYMAEVTAGKRLPGLHVETTEFDLVM